VLKPDAKPTLIGEALPFIPANHPRLKIDFLNRLLKSEDEGLRQAAILTIRERPMKESQPSLLGVMLAKDPTALQLEAIVGLSPEDPDSRKFLLALARGSDHRMRREALRSLKNAKLTADDFDRIQAASGNDPASLELVAAMQGRKSTRPKPTDQTAWMKLLDGNGDADPDAGRRLFFHPQGPGCYKCHRVNERGGLGGPDLSAVGGSLTRERILESILQPSKEVAPMFTSWTLVMNDGTTRVGLFVGGSNQNTQIYFDPEGRQFEVKPEDVETRKPNPNSIMPAELVDRMTDQELRDLLAFLEAKKK
jgi:putative heme-binding domain-containing protein